jgi:hypothetical protein
MRRNFAAALLYFVSLCLAADEIHLKNGDRIAPMLRSSC